MSIEEKARAAVKSVQNEEKEVPRESTPAEACQESPIMAIDHLSEVEEALDKAMDEAAKRIEVRKYIEDLAEADMVAELRRRGWEVKCTRTTIEEL